MNTDNQDRRNIDKDNIEGTLLVPVVVLRELIKDCKNLDKSILEIIPKRSNYDVYYYSGRIDHNYPYYRQNNDRSIYEHINTVGLDNRQELVFSRTQIDKINEALANCNKCTTK